jgi:hypothetical protein
MEHEAAERSDQDLDEMGKHETHHGSAQWTPLRLSSNADGAQLSCERRLSMQAMIEEAAQESVSP